MVPQSIGVLLPFALICRPFVPQYGESVFLPNNYDLFYSFPAIMWPLMLDYSRDECVRFLREMGKLIDACFIR